MRLISTAEENCEVDSIKMDLFKVLPNSSPLRMLSDRIDWKSLESYFSDIYCPDNGRPGVSIRVLLGLHLLKYIEDFSDKKAIKNLAGNIEWQYFCGFRYFEFKEYCDESTLVRFRQKIGSKGVERLLAETIRIGEKEKLVSAKDYEKVHVDVTVQEKNITFPHDVKHLLKIQKKLLRALKKKVSSKTDVWED